VPIQIRETKLPSGFVVLEPIGRLESKTSPDLDKKVVALLAAGERKFVVDLAGIEYVSSAGLRVLLMLAKKLSGGAGRLALCGLNPPVREVFEIAGLGTLLALYPTRDAALAAAEAAVPPTPKPLPAAAPVPPKTPVSAPPPVPSPEEVFIARVAAAFGPLDAAGGPPPAESVDASLVARAAAALATRPR